MNKEEGITLNDLPLLVKIWRQRVMPKTGNTTTQSFPRGIKYQMYIKWRRDVAKGSMLYTFLLSKCVTPQERDDTHLFTTRLSITFISIFILGIIQEQRVKRKKSLYRSLSWPHKRRTKHQKVKWVSDLWVMSQWVKFWNTVDDWYNLW